MSAIAVLTAHASTKTFSNIDQMTGWQSCDRCAGPNGWGKTASHWMKQYIASPSMDGKSAEFFLGGSNPYASALWWKQLGSNSSATHFVYDLWFYVKQPQNVFALEFDTNQSTGGKRYIMGTQCGVHYDKQWAVYDAAGGAWRNTGIGCPVPKAYSWNHLVWEFYRAKGRVYYVSFTLNGAKHYVNRSYYACSSSANDINVAFQMDGNSSMADYNTWLDKVKLTYW
jgi:hypothetical protein